MSPEVSKLVSLIRAKSPSPTRTHLAKARGVIESIPLTTEAEIDGVKLGMVMLPELRTTRVTNAMMDDIVVNLEDMGYSQSARAAVVEAVGGQASRWLAEAKTVEGRLMRLIWLIGKHTSSVTLDRQSSTLITDIRGYDVGFYDGKIVGLLGEGQDICMPWEDAAIDIPRKLRVSMSVKLALDELREADAEAHTAALALLTRASSDRVLSLGVTYLLMNPQLHKQIDMEEIDLVLEMGFDINSYMTRKLRGRVMAPSHYDSLIGNIRSENLESARRAVNLRLRNLLLID